MTKRLGILLLLMVLPALVVPSMAATVGVSMATFNDNFLTTIRLSMQARGGQVKAPIQFEDAQNDVGRQLSQVQNFLAQGVDVIVVNAVDTQTTPAITRLASRAGIPLVYVNRQPADKQLPPKVAFVGSDEAELGTLQMQEVCRILGGKGSIVILMGELTNQSTRMRTQAVYDVISRPECRGIHVLDKQTASWKRTEAADLVTNWISAGLRPNAVVSNNDEMAIGAAQALKRAHLLSGTVVVGIDATIDGLAALRAGDLRATVFQNGMQQGAVAVDTALRLVRGENVDSAVKIASELVTPANLSNYLKGR